MFASIVGHRSQLQVLQRALVSQRLHHAYLFVGPEGVGKKTVALALAAAANCLYQDHDACGECQSCLCIRDGNHPDIHLVTLPKGKKEIGIQQVRDLQKQLALRGLSRGRKIAIIDPASGMNYPTQNALLKTLEEPPGNSLIFLIATSAGGILPTVQSRCVRIQFSSLDVEQVAAILREKRQVSDEVALLLAAMSYGSLGRALTCNEHEVLQVRRGWIERLSALEAGDLRGVMMLAEEVSSDREKSLAFLEWVKSWLRDLTVFRVTGSTEHLCNRDMLPQLADKAMQRRIEKLAAVFPEVERATAQINRNFNRRLVLESFIPKLLD